MTWRHRHRGPYTFHVERPSKKNPDQWQSSSLPGHIDADDVLTEAMALLADTRDNIVRVHVWSVREEQFVMTYRKAA
jgi:hypothetical protein